MSTPNSSINSIICVRSLCRLRSDFISCHAVIIKMKIVLFIWLIILTLVRWLSRWFFVLSLWILPLSINIGESKTIRWTVYTAHDVFSFGFTLYCGPVNCLLSLLELLVRVGACSCVAFVYKNFLFRFYTVLFSYYTYRMYCLLLLLCFLFIFQMQDQISLKIALSLSESFIVQFSVCQFFISLSKIVSFTISPQLAFRTNLARNNNYSYEIEFSGRHTHYRHFMIRAFVLIIWLFFSSRRKSLLIFIEHLSLFAFWHVLSQYSMALTIDSASEC